MTPSDNLMPLDVVRARLATLWLSAGSIILIVVVLQSLLGHYGDKVQEVWGWLLPTLMPTLGMIVSVLGFTAIDPKSLAAVVRRSFFRVAFWLSAVYLLLIALGIVIPGSVRADAQQSVETMRLSNLWLGPVQALVASALGVLFVSKKDKGKG